jgi:hypothetical protein
MTNKSKTAKPKPASQEVIEFACEMICREFGVLKSQSFQIKHNTIAYILEKEKLDEIDYRNFLSEMLIHQYFVAVTSDYFIFFHISLAASLKEADDDIIECFDFCKENEIKGCEPEEMPHDIKKQLH